MSRITISLIFLTAAVVLFFSQTQGYFGDIKNLKVQTAAYDEALANSREFQVLKNDLLSKYNNLPQGDLERLNKLLPLQTGSGDLIVILEDRAKTHGLLLKKIEAKESTGASVSGAVLAGSPSQYKTMDLTLLMSGPYASFFNFLIDLERSVRLIDVNKIKFSVSSADSYEYEINAKAYAALEDASSLNAGIKEADFLAVLNKLRNIKIDPEFFNNDIFKSLGDFSRKLEIPQEYGRINPFAPF